MNLDRNDLKKMIQSFKSMKTQSEEEVKSKFIVPLIKWLGYNDGLRAEEYPVYGSEGSKDLPAKHADYILFADCNFADFREKSKKNLEWVYKHSLLVVEAKKQGEMPTDNMQAQYYSNWTKTPAYIITDGDFIRGYLYNEMTSDSPVLDCSISDLIYNESLTVFSYDNLKSVKEGADLINSEFRKRASQIQSDKIPDMPENHFIRRKIFSEMDSTASGEIPFASLHREKRIVLLGEAGQGKTYVLYQMYYEAKENGYRPLFYRLRSLQNENDVELLADGKINIDSKIALLLDGLDEMQEDMEIKVIKAIKRIVERNFDILVIVSSRKNTYSNQLEGFKKYAIEPITITEKEVYLKSKNIELNEWNDQIDKHNLHEISNNLFYLCELATIWEKKCDLPDLSEVMDKIINTRIENDADRKNEYAVSLDSLRGKIWRLFEKMALVMKCIKRYDITDDELNQLLNDLEGNSIKKEYVEIQGLWYVDQQTQCWRFAHNNFLEFFAASALSKLELQIIKCYICERENNEAIRPSWYNVLSYLAGIYKKRDLQEWILRSQPEMIIHFEKDRFSDDERSNILKSIFDDNKKRKTWVDINSVTSSKIAEFCATAKAEDYLLDELEKQQTLRHTQNLLRCLEYFPNFANEHRLVKIIQSIAFDANMAIFVRIDAFRVMNNHSSIFNDDAEFKSISILKTSNEEYLCYHALRYLQNRGTIYKYIDVALQLYDKYKINHKGIDFIWMLKSIFEDEDQNDIENANKILGYFLQNRDYKGDYDFEIIEKCLRIGSIHHSENDIVLRTLMDFLCDEHVYMFDNYPRLSDLLKEYIQKTHTALAFASKIIMFDDYRSGNLALSLLNEEMGDAYCELIRTSDGDEKEKAVSMVKKIIRSYSKDKKAEYRKIMDKLKSAVYFVTGEDVPFEQNMEKNNQFSGFQLFFSSLFDIDKLGNMVEELIAFTSESIDNQDDKDDKMMLAIIKKWEFCYLYLFISHSNKASQLYDVQTFKENIKGMDDYRYSEIAKYIRSYRNVINLTKEQKTCIVDFCSRYFESMDFGKLRNSLERNDKLEIVENLAWCCQYFSIRFPEEVVSQLIALPPNWFEESENENRKLDLFDFEKKDDGPVLPEYLENQLSAESIRKTIVNLVNSNRMNRHVASIFSNYCKIHKIKECKESIIEYLVAHQNNYNITYMLDYLRDTFGYDSILNELLPKTTSTSLLCAIADYVPNDMKSDSLDKKLWGAFSSEQGNSFPYLLKRNNLKALEYYYDCAKQTKKAPSIEFKSTEFELVRAISSINSIECLPYLIKLFDLVLIEGFSESKSIKIEEACRMSIPKISESDYKETKRQLDEASKTIHAEFQEAIIEQKQIIESKHKLSEDNALNFDLAISLVCSCCK